ncbi:MAG: sugar ABC transporter permease [Sulfobacillus thermosulfidooxidans]|nr:MAG: sugar ABC transporter permease [Sulfobacillus thermosulfidooxidans]
MLKEHSVRERTPWIDASSLVRYAHRTRLVTPWLMLAPALLGLSVFVLLPTVAIVGLSFTNWNLMTPHPHWAGVANYRSVLTSFDFWNAMQHTVIYAAAVAIVILPASFGLAWLLNYPLRGRNVYRMIFFLPYVMPLAASGIVFSGLLSPSSGLINILLGHLHITGPNWLGSVHWALIAVIAVTIWEYVGFYMLLFLSGLQQLNPALSEAAAMDGAGSWPRFWHVILPQLVPTIVFAGVMVVIQTFQAFDQIYVMTAGGPVTATTTLVYYIYEQGFQFFNVGQASTASVLFVMLVGAITVIQWRGMHRWGGDGS